MKTTYPIPVTREVDTVASQKRRDEYALTRDKQALENNEAIQKRFLSEERNLVKCKQCGKEFSAGTESLDDLTCPDCKQTDNPVNG
jgi:predicted Zn-ribbon and HTH transcriptional regulator